jgi:hypothetical protein
LDQQRTTVGLLDGDVHPGREAGLCKVSPLAVSLRDAVLGVLGNGALTSTLVDGLVALVALEIHLIAQAGVIEVLLLAQVLDIGDGERNANPNNSNVLISLTGSIAIRGSILLVAERLREGHLLLSGNILDRPIASLQNIVDILRLILQVLQTRLVLVRQFIIKLGDKLGVPYDRSQTSVFFPS